MELPIHSLETLFEQLGLPADEDAIERFVATHRPVAAGLALHEAPFWTPAQAELLRDAVHEDADWAEVADQLNAMLR